MTQQKQAQAVQPRKRKVRRKGFTGLKGPCQYREITLGNGVMFKGLANKKDPLTGDGELHLTNGSVYKGQIYKG